MTQERMEQIKEMARRAIPYVMESSKPQQDDYLLTRDYWDYRAEIGDIPGEESDPMPEGYTPNRPLAWPATLRDAGDIRLFLLCTERFIIALGETSSYAYLPDGSLVAESYTDNHREYVIDYIFNRERDGW